MGVAAVLVSGCQLNGRSGLTVATAADLQPAFKQIAKVFERQTGQPVTLIVSSSGLLARQIEQGAPIDVFASASKKYVDDLVKEKLVLAHSVRPFAIGRLVLVKRARSSFRLASLDDLQRFRIDTIAVANPEHAPYGTAAVEAMKRRGVWKSLRQHIVYADSVLQAWQFVQSGNADSGIVALSLVKPTGAGYHLIDARLHNPIVQTIGQLRYSKNPVLARKFVRLVLSRQGQAILRRTGFEEVR